MEAHEQVNFRTMFPDSWEKLQQKGATVYNIRSEGGGFRVTVDWVRSRLVSTLLKPFRRKNDLNQNSVGWHLYNAYVQQFSLKSTPELSSLSHQKLGQRQIHWMPGEIPHTDSITNLNNRQNFQVAVAMQLAGIVKIKEQDKSDRLQPTGQPVDAASIATLDRCINSSPTRLAYEYIAAGQSKKLPARFIPLLLIPHLSERLTAGTGVNEQEAGKIIEGLLQQHKIEKPSDLSLENLMDIKNAIRRMGNEHRRVASSLTGQRYITRQPKHKVSQTPIKARPQISATPSEQLLADAGATIDSAHDHFFDQLRSAGLPAEEATQQIKDLFKAQNMQGEADFTLTRFIALADQVSGIARKARRIKGHTPASFRSYESEVSVIEYFSRLKYQNTYKSDHLPTRHLSVHSQQAPKPVSNWSIKQDKNGKWLPHGLPALDRPDCDPDILCDADDEWLIKQQVDNGHLMRLAKDFSMRLVRWCGRNKRVIGVQAGLLALMGVVYGVQTGGISVAIMLVTYVCSSVTWLAVDTVADRIQRIRIAGKLKRADHARSSHNEKDEPGKEIDDYLDSYSWLTRQHGLTNILNGFKNLQNEVHSTEQKPLTDDIDSVIKRRRAQCLSQLRSDQLEDSFGSLDKLVVESVQEVSRLDHHFASNFNQLWQPLEQLNNRERMKVFNDAANSAGIKKQWYLPNKDFSHWVHQTLTHKTTDTDRLALFLEEKLRLDQPLSQQELQLKDINDSIDTHFGRTLAVARTGLKTGADYIKTTLRSTLWRNIESGITKATLGTNPTLSGLTPIPTAMGALFWAYSFAATKITETLNKLHNQNEVKEYRSTHTEDRFDVGFKSNPDQQKAARARNDYDDNLLAIRREAKESTKEFIATIKDLREEKQNIDEELQQHLKQTGQLTHAQYVARASLILKHKMLEQKIYKLMNDALGNMHHETVKAASWLQDSAGIYTE